MVPAPAQAQVGQDGVATNVDAPNEAAPNEDTPNVDDPETVDVEGPPPAIGAFGVSVGFPSYQTVAVSFSVQAQYLGFQVKGSLTPVGPYFGVQARGYPPVPFPVPVYVGIGAGFYGPNTTLFALVGGHVPLSLNLRLDVEAGVAQVPLLDKRQIAPYVSLGVSYAFPLPPAPPPGQVTALDTVRGSGGPVAVCVEPEEPDRKAITRAVKSTVKDWLDSARATYGSIYTDLSYDYDIRGVDIDGDMATVEVHYRGSVRSIATGERQSANGEAVARFRWNGCEWRGAGVSY